MGDREYDGDESSHGGSRRRPPPLQRVWLVVPVLAFAACAVFVLYGDFGNAFLLVGIGLLSLFLNPWDRDRFARFAALDRANRGRREAVAQRRYLALGSVSLVVGAVMLFGRVLLILGATLFVFGAILAGVSLKAKSIMKQ